MFSMFIHVVHVVVVVVVISVGDGVTAARAQMGGLMYRGVTVIWNSLLRCSSLLLPLLVTRCCASFRPSNPNSVFVHEVHKERKATAEGQGRTNTYMNNL